MIHNDSIEAQTKGLKTRYSRLLLGEGLFETMAICNARVAHAELHWQRMNNSAKVLKIPFQTSLADWLSKISEKLALEKCERGIVKVILIPISEKRGLAASAEYSDILWQIYESDMPSKPVNLLSLPWYRDSNNPMYRHKTLSYMDNILAKRYAQSMGSDDGLFYDQSEQVLEATSANIFAVINRELYTPSLNQAVLPGIMRKLIMDRAKKQGIPCFEQKLTRDDLAQADALFLTNSLIEILPVKQFDGQKYDVKHAIYQLLRR